MKVAGPDECTKILFRWPPMDRQAYDKARDEAAKAALKIKELRSAKTIGEVADLWSEFLTHTQRSYTKLRIACRAGPSKGWCDRVFATRNADDLLKYVLHARNADEHGVAAITHQKEGAVQLRAKEGNTMEVDYLEASPGRIVMGPKLAADAHITIIPGEVLLLPVRDRGIVYDVPKIQLGEELASPTLLEVADRAEAFLRGKLDEARSMFGEV